MTVTVKRNDDVKIIALDGQIDVATSDKTPKKLSAYLKTNQRLFLCRKFLTFQVRACVRC